MNKKKKVHNRRTRKKPVSSINPKDLVKKAKTAIQEKFVSKLTFNDLDLHPQLLKNLTSKGYNRPTEIQEKSIPLLIIKNDIIGIAATGTGKTGAFLIPIIHQMLENNRVNAFVVVPTRELAQQVKDEYNSLTKGFNFNAVCFIGGTNINKDITLAKRKNRFIVGTPGRINDLINRRALNLNNSSVLVLDEFDRMLDMGFINEVRKIESATSNRTQTMLFSATVDKSQKDLVNEFVTAPKRVNVTTGTSSSDNVDQDIIEVKSSENKFDLLLDLLNDKAFKKVILFTETKRNADRISVKLNKKGLNSDAIHGNKSQNYRSKAIKLFKSGKIKILVATDVAARGIDIDDVTHVINYQLPLTMDSYIHRIGRTGRAGKKGAAYTFVN